MKDKHLVVISIDAMVTKDIDYAKTLPNFKKIIDGAAMIPSVTTIYPTLTHPIHATLLTGTPVSATGIPNNIIFHKDDPTISREWYNRLDEIKCDTIFHAAKRAGYTTAASTWPVTVGGEKYIDYLIPGALNYYFEGRENDLPSVYRSLGAPECVMDIIADSVEKYGSADVHPSIDFYQFGCACEIIKRFKPGLLLMHPGNVDAARHKNGIYGEAVLESLREVDEMLGMLLGALEDADILDSTDIVLLSDHGQIGITRAVSPNVFLKEAGFITVDEDGKLEDWSAFAKSAGGSAQVYLKDPSDKETHDKVYALLSEMASKNLYGFERVYTTSEVEAEYGLSGDFSFVLETDGYTRFDEWLLGSGVKGFDYGDYSTGRGTHGYLPSKGPQPIFIAKGPSFKEGVVMSEGSILNHAPTLAKVLGVELKDAVGHAVEEILK